MPLDYDPLLAKLAVWADSRDDAIARMERALWEYYVAGITTNISFFRQVLDDPEFRAGHLHTGFIEEFQARRTEPVIKLDAEYAAVAAMAAAAYALERKTGLRRDAGQGIEPLAGGRKETVTVMRLLVKLDGKAGELQLERRNGDCSFHFECGEIGAISGDASLIETEPGIFSVLVGGRSYEAKVVPNGDAYYVDLRGHRSSVEIRDPRSMVPRGRAAGGEGRQSIVAPMPGKVVSILVAEGQEVEAGAGLIVVEAMKMQNELKAPKTGRVTAIHARQGETVTAGQGLIDVE